MHGKLKQAGSGDDRGVIGPVGCMLNRTVSQVRDCFRDRISDFNFNCDID